MGSVSECKRNVLECMALGKICERVVSERMGMYGRDVTFIKNPCGMYGNVNRMCGNVCLKLRIVGGVDENVSECIQKW